jgi:hypothetical protein
MSEMKDFKVEISYSPYAYFLKPRNDALNTSFLLSVFFHTAMILGYFYWPQAEHQKPTQAARKGLSSLPVVVWNQDPRLGGVPFQKKDLSNSEQGSTTARHSQKKSSMVLPITPKKFDGLRSDPFKIARTKGSGVLREWDKTSPAIPGYVLYPEGHLSGLEESDHPLGQGRSSQATAEELENKKTTSVSELLKDDEFVFTSFFTRLKENLYPVWVRKVRTKLSDRDFKISPTARTRLLVRTDEQGLIKKIEQMESSGCLACDDIAQESLLSLARVNHPPRGFRQADGLFDFKLTFTIYTQYSSSFIDVEPVEPQKQWPRAR